MRQRQSGGDESNKYYADDACRRECADCVLHSCMCQL